MDRKTYFEKQKNRYGAGELSWCAQKAKELYPEEAEHILRIADQVCRLEFLFDLPWDMERTYEIETFTFPIDWRYMPTDDPEFVYQMNRHRYFICLGQAYAMTGEEKYAKAFVRIAEDWIEREPLTEESRTRTWREIEAGLRGENWTKAVLYFEHSPSLTDSFMEKFTESLRAHGEYLMKARRGFQISSNWGVLENHGLYLIGMALGEEAYLETAAERLLEEVSVQVFGDGVHWEQSCMYHNEVLHCCLEVLNAMAFSGREIPEDFLDKTAKMAMVNLYWKKPDHCQPLMGDSDETDLRDMLTAAAIVLKRAGRKEEAEFLKGGSYGKPDYESLWDLRRQGMEDYEGISGRALPEKDWFLEESGNFYIRSGWEGDAEYLHFRCGCLGGGHGHNDKLHIDVVSAGEDILVDGGRYQYTYQEENRVWLKSAWAHNTVLVDGKDFMEYPGAWGVEGMGTELRFPVKRQGRFTLLEGGHTGYLQKGCGVLLTRKILVLKPGIYLLADTAYTSEEHTYSRLFHFHNQGKVVYAKDRIRYNGRKAKAELFFPGQGNQIQPVKSKFSRHYNLCEENPAVEIRNQAKGKTTLFCIFAAGQKNPVQVRKLPVYNPVRNCDLKEEYAQALEITTDEEVYTVIFRHQDLAGPCDLLRAGSCMGIGRLLVSGKDGETAVFA